MNQKIDTAIDHLLDLIVEAPFHEASNIESITRAITTLSYLLAPTSLQEVCHTECAGTECDEATQSVKHEMNTASAEVEKPKRTRRTKAEIEAERAAVAATEEEPEPEPELESEPTPELEPTVPDNVTRQTIRDYFIANKSADLKSRFATILSEYEAKSVTDVPDDKIAEFHSKLIAK